MGTGKKRMFLSMAVFVITLSIIGWAESITALAEAADVIRWKVQSVNAPAETQLFHRTWLDKITEASNGRIEFQLFSAGQLVPDDQVLQAVQRGTLDMAHGSNLSMNYSMDIYHEGAIGTYTPFAWRSPMELYTMMKHRGLEEVVRGAFESIENIKFLEIHITDPLHILSRKPINSMADIKGLKISAHRNIARPFLDFGASAVQVPTEEFYLAGQSGIVDALAWCGATEGVNNGWVEVFPYFLSNQINGAAFCEWFVNEKTWKSIPKDLQELILVGLRAEISSTNGYYYGREALMRNKYKVTSIPKDEWQRIVDAQITYWDQIAAKSQRCKKVIQIYKEYNEEVERTQWWR